MVILSDLSGVFVGGAKQAALIIKERYGDSVFLRCKRRLAELSVEYQALLRGEIHEDFFWDEYFLLHEEQTDVNPWPFGPDEAKATLTEAIKQTIPGTLELLKSIVAYPDIINPKFSLDDTVIVDAGNPPELYILSDYSNERINEVRSWHPELFRFTNDEYWSCDLGLTKLQDEFFAEVMQDLCIEPCEAIYIDDSEIKVDISQRAGLTGIRFENSTQLRTVFEGYGFRFKF